MQIDFILADSLRTAEMFAYHQGWVRKAHHSWTTSEEGEVRYTTRDCEFRNAKMPKVYLAYGSESSPAYAAAREWARRDRVTLIQGIL